MPKSCVMTTIWLTKMRSVKAFVVTVQPGAIASIPPLRVKTKMRSDGIFSYVVGPEDLFTTTWVFHLI